MDTSSLTKMPKLYNGQRKDSSVNGADLTGTQYVKNSENRSIFVYLAQTSSPSGSRSST